MFLAELSGLETAGVICSIIFGAIACVVATVACFKKQETQISPQPLIVAMQKEFATKHDLDQHIAQTARGFAQMDQELKQDRSDNQRHASARQKTLFDSFNEKHSENSTRLNSLDKSVAALEATSDLQNQKLSALDIKLDNMPARIIETLDRMGVLGK